jgi:uncharacterized protein YbjQ (UPF0145 family)
VNEFALLARLGPQPLAQVMGASVVQTGWQYLPPLPPGQYVTSGPWYAQMTNRGAIANPYTEASIRQVIAWRRQTDVVCLLPTLTDAWNLARRQARDRLVEEALNVGADAVVGVHLRRSEHDFGSGTIDFVISGTAIRLPGSTGTTWPTLTDLSVQDYWKLRNAGHEPVGLLAASVVVFASPSLTKRARRARTPGRNQELDELARGFQLARDTIRRRLQGQVMDDKADGAIGVEFTHSVHRQKLALGSSLQSPGQIGWHRGRLGIPYRVTGATDSERRGWVITMHAAGTAVRHAGPTHRPTKPVLRLGASR